ncbi:EscF/YscF/HrpA family type III secretion system needle major subunit [Succinatimonas hippei]|uniref:Type III secretion system protein, YscF family n=1 Tax=Succinatimonas hippei (strain DSM 22608 / JCM 16073 / KCTC 15190 / YIT 12066) TaxID=762983 RepID=E8LIU0_SUCHY|nr:EscF/YscF/HrpA family type III secretion system needle major subunit [Succinatimonas hippei]EFY07564.1 type III secretion system protein, YscF family [Succinatimonas hippei YIT 12066]
MEISGSSFADMIKTGMDNMSEKAEQMKEKMANISSLDSTEDQQAALLEMQFEMGQYNAVMELTANLVKSLSESIKSISQKVS